MKVINHIRKTFLFWSLLGLLFVALFSNFIANDRPIIASENGTLVFPVFQSQNRLIVDKTYEWVIMPLIPYSPQSLDYRNAKSASPFKTQQVSSLRYRHWLGTDEIGRDILSGIIHGTQLALLIGIGSMLIAAIIGIFWGAIAGFFGDHSLKLSWINFILIPIFSFIGYFYGFHQTVMNSNQTFITIIQNGVLNITLIVMGVLLAGFTSHHLHKELNHRKLITIPIDLMISRFIEMVKSIPILFLVISIAAIVQPSVWNIIWIIGLIAWTNIARYTRAEVLKVKNKPHVESAKALGFSNTRILFKHILPHSLQSASVYIVFGIAAAILTESTLSFIGIGIAADHVSWGGILSEARKSPSSWWLAVFPGLAIFMTLYLFNRLATVIEDRNRN
jgi:peptide/nickel transport system permease protein